jgi:hypothetical protein
LFDPHQYGRLGLVGVGGGGVLDEEQQQDGNNDELWTLDDNEDNMSQVSAPSISTLFTPAPSEVPSFQDMQEQLAALQRQMAAFMATAQGQQPPVVAVVVVPPQNAPSSSNSNVAVIARAANKEVVFDWNYKL